MGNKDINLFKAAGGDRAKGAKRSPVTYMLLVTLIIIVASVGVLVLFNMKANNAEKSYNAKKNVISNYDNTIMNVQESDEGGVSLADEYRIVRDDIDAAAAIGTYIDSISTLFPKASDTEVAAVKNLLLGYGYSVNDPVEDEEFETWDIEGLRESLYEENAQSFEGRELFYYALQRLAEDQKKSPSTNVWYTYYRDYMLVVFTGGDGTGLDTICNLMIGGGVAMDGNAPFTKLEMANDTFLSSSDYYAPAKYFWKVYETSDTAAITFNCLLMPMKTIIERTFDILEAHSNALITDNGWEGQLELASYGVTEMHYASDSLSFNLILPDKDLFTDYVKELDNSRFFSVSNSVYLSAGDTIGDYTSWKILLEYKSADKKTDTSEEEE